MTLHYEQAGTAGYEANTMRLCDYLGLYPTCTCTDSRMTAQISSPVLFNGEDYKYYTIFT